MRKRFGIRSCREVLQMKKNPAAVALGRRGGLKSGKARMKNLTPEKRSELARHAAQARWAKKGRKRNA
jgi:hypothetical protein